MGIDIGNIINSTVNWICNDSIIATIISNAFLTSILIVVIVLLIIRYYFNTKKVNMPKIIGYLFIIISGILFVHYSAVVQKADKKYKNKAEVTIMENLSKPMEISPIAAIPQMFATQAPAPAPAQTLPPSPALTPTPTSAPVPASMSIPQTNQLPQSYPVLSSSVPTIL